MYIIVALVCFTPAFFRARAPPGSRTDDCCCCCCCWCCCCCCCCSTHNLLLMSSVRINILKTLPHERIAFSDYKVCYDVASTQAIKKPGAPPSFDRCPSLRKRASAHCGLECSCKQLKTKQTTTEQQGALHVYISNSKQNKQYWNNRAHYTSSCTWQLSAW